jgi:hypothetical protein
MGGWDSLRVDLQLLLEESPGRPGALVVGPNPYSERRSGRWFHIELAAWATDIAAELKATYREVVDLQVGALTFPIRELRMNELARQLPGTPADSAVGSSARTMRDGWDFRLRLSRLVPVLIGTPSVIPELGFAVSPGEWSLVVSLQTDEGYMLSAPLAITITP